MEDFLSEWLLLFTVVQRSQGTWPISFILLFLLPCRLVWSTQRWWWRIHGRKIIAYAQWGLHTSAAFTCVQGMGVIVHKCFIRQLSFRKVWLPQQLPQAVIYSMMLPACSTAQSRLNWCQFGATSTAAPTFPLSPSQLMEPTDGSFHILLVLAWSVCWWPWGTRDAWSPLWWSQHRAAVGGFPFSARRTSNEESLITVACGWPKASYLLLMAFSPLAFFICKDNWCLCW